VSKPKSTSSAPSETKPSGIFKAPEATPAKNDVKKFGSFSSSLSLSKKTLYFSFCFCQGIDHLLNRIVALGIHKSA
jgi:hypothetical protein